MDIILISILRAVVLLLLLLLIIIIAAAGAVIPGVVVVVGFVSVFVAAAAVLGRMTGTSTFLLPLNQHHDASSNYRLTITHLIIHL